MKHWFPALLAFLTACSTLTMEIVAARLLAPYVGVTLQTYTAIIGVVLAGISIGAFIGGRLSDRFDPRLLLAPVIVLGGALVLASLPMLRLVGRWAGGGGSIGAMILAGGAFLAPALVLSMVSPLVIKLTMTSMETAGAAVGRIEASGTAGAIFGTFFAGFVLVAKMASDTILIVEGIFLVALGVVVWLVFGRGRKRAGAVLASSLLFAGGALGGTILRDHPCAYETRYFCVNVEEDSERPTGRYLVLDQLTHSYVDLADPLHLEFEYVRAIVAGIEAQVLSGPIRTLHVGGGGFTVPTFLRETRPGSINTVIERDGGLTKLDQSLLGLRLGDGLTAIAGDGRAVVREQAAQAWDVVIGDAFGGEAVPWHLATQEFLLEVFERLDEGGMYALNVIDSPPKQGVPGKFIRAEIATVKAVFPHVAVATSPSGWDGLGPENFVVYAAATPIAVGQIQANLDLRSVGWTVREGDELSKWVGGAQVLTDRFAPVDQLLTVVT
jgi:MFS family permease